MQPRKITKNNSKKQTKSNTFITKPSFQVFSSFFKVSFFFFFFLIVLLSLFSLFHSLFPQKDWEEDRVSFLKQHFERSLLSSKLKLFEFRSHLFKTKQNKTTFSFSRYAAIYCSFPPFMDMTCKAVKKVCEQVDVAKDTQTFLETNRTGESFLLYTSPSLYPKNSHPFFIFSPLQVFPSPPTFHMSPINPKI